MESCKSGATTISSGSPEGDKPITISAIQILYNLANFSRPRFYIPGETVRNARERYNFLLWGGLLCLDYVSKNTKNQEIAQYCENTVIKYMDIKDYEDIASSIKLFLESKNGTYQEGMTDPDKIVAINNNEVVKTPGNRIPTIETSSPADICFPE